MWPKSGMGLMGTVVITANGLQPLISAICPTCSLPIGLAPVALSSSNAFGGTCALLPCPWTCAAIWQSWPGGLSALEAHSGSTSWWDHPWQFLISESELRLGEVKVWCSEVFWTASLQLIRMKLPPAIPLSTDQILPSLPHLLGQRSAFLWIHPYYCVAVLNICLSFLCLIFPIRLWVFWEEEPHTFFISGSPAPSSSLELIQVKVVVLGENKGSPGGGPWEVKGVHCNSLEAPLVLLYFWASPGDPGQLLAFSVPPITFPIPPVVLRVKAKETECGQGSIREGNLATG